MPRSGNQLPRQQAFQPGHGHSGKPPRTPDGPQPRPHEEGEGEKSKYSRLLLVAETQYRQRVRRSPPVFSAFAVSTTGELSPDANLLVSWITWKFKEKCRKAGPRPDGLTSREMVIDYKHRLRVALQFAVASGMGDIIREAGTKKPLSRIPYRIPLRVSSRVSSRVPSRVSRVS